MCKKLSTRPGFDKEKFPPTKRKNRGYSSYGYLIAPIADHWQYQLMFMVNLHDIYIYDSHTIHN